MAIHLTGSFAVSGSVDAQSFTQNGQPLTSDPFPYTGSAEITGSLNVVGDLLQNGAPIETDPFPYTGDAQINGGLGVSGSVGFSYSVSIPGAWTAGNALINGRYGAGGAGTQTAGLAIGGMGTNYSPTTVTEEYDGSTWSAGGSLITARTTAGAGTQNAGLAIGGGGFQARSCTEEYNGSSWSTGGALITLRENLAGAGTQNAGLAIGGNNGGGIQGCTEEYDGTSWSAGSALITSRCGLAGAGTQNAGLIFGGAPNYNTATGCTEEYDGSSWSAGGALITARYLLGGAGEQNAGLAFGGYPSLSCTEEYNGSTWSAGGALITARQSVAGTGTQNAGLAFGGRTPSPSTCTEEYNSPEPSITTTFDYSSTTGETTVSCLIETSAERYKSNIQPLGSQLSNIMNLQPVEFDWKTNKKHDIGFVADSVESVYPNLVSKNAQGEIEGMNYSKLVSALVKSMQEQQQQIQSLQTKIDKLDIN